MKKVLSIVLSLVMVLCMMPVMAFAGTASGQYPDVSGEACENAVTTLSNLGVINGYEDGTYKPENVVTRAEAAKLVISALGLSDQAKGSTASFTDLANAKWAEGYIGYAESLGILEGDGDGKFRPADPVTYNEFAAIMVRALGYTDESLQGSYPAAHMAKANALGIMDDITGAGGANGANRGDCAIMLYNNLTNYIGTTDKDGQWSASVGSNGQPSDTMMKRLGATVYQFDGDETEGVVTVTEADKAIIDIYPYIGAQATLYKNKDGDIIAIADIKSTFLTGKFTSDGKFEADGVKYTVEDDDNTVFLKNGVIDKTQQSNPTGECTIAAKVSGKTLKEVYSANSWVADANDQISASQVKKISSEKYVLNSAMKLPTDDNGDIDTSAFILNGVDSLDKIVEDNIVAVYKAGNDVIKVEVGTETVTGKITKVQTKNGETTYTIDDKEYKVSKLSNASATGLTVGTEAKFYLDYNGKIYATSNVEENVNYGVVLKSVGTESSYDDTKYLIKLFKTDGTSAVLEVKNSTVGKGINAGTLVSYKVNADGVVTEVKAATETVKGEYKNGVLGGKLCADDMVVIVDNGGDKSDADNYTVTNADSLKGELKSNYYFANNDDDIKAVLVDKAATNITDIYGFISDYSTVLNDDEESVIEITGVANGEAFTYITTLESFPAGIEEGTFVKLAKSGNEVTSIVKANFGGSGDGALYHDGGTNVLAVTNVANANLWLTEVKGINNDKVLVKDAYEVIKGATVYIPKFDSSDDFIGWEIGSVDDIEINGYISLMQMDEDASNWDTVVYIPDTAAGKTLVKTLS